jgi:putative transposase
MPTNDGFGANDVERLSPPCRPPRESHPKGAIEAPKTRSLRAVARLTRGEGLRARMRKRYRCTTMSERDHPVAANLLERRFEAEQPNQRWVGDVTEILTGQGKLYLAVILDLFSRMVVGRALSAANDRHLALRALEQALRRRCPEAGLLHHTDQGSPYASEDYQRVLAAHGIICSMSRRGSAYDNAAMESRFSTMTFELGDRFETHADAKARLFDYIEVFYNQERRHSTLGYLCPAYFERAARMEQAAA